MQIFLSLNDNNNYLTLIKKKLTILHFYLSRLQWWWVFSDFYCKLKYGSNGLIEGNIQTIMDLVSGKTKFMKLRF